MVGCRMDVDRVERGANGEEGKDVGGGGALLRTE